MHEELQMSDNEVLQAAVAPRRRTRRDKCRLLLAHTMTAKQDVRVQKARSRRSSGQHTAGRRWARRGRSAPPPGVLRGGWRGGGRALDGARGGRADASNTIGEVIYHTIRHKTVRNDLSQNCMVSCCFAQVNSNSIIFYF